ncbi:sugar/nucleoside kinase (ribokinase family) [Bradyrhizobium sp. i1.7.7]
MSAELLALVDILVLNETELGFLAGVELSDGDEAATIIDVARQLQAREDQIICVTLGKRGVLALAGRKEFAVSGRAVKAVDTTGAGDCFVGALAAQLAEGVSLRTALAFANAAASISVQRMGAGPSMPTAAEVAAVL